MSARSNASRRAYTMIEVMTALGLLAVGATGIVAMQKAAIVGNSSAKSISAATSIAARWAERLRVDSMVWNASTSPELAQTRWLKTVATTPGVWTLPTAIAGKVAPYADSLGADIMLANDTSAVAFCTHVSYRQLTPKMVSAIVRVTWRRDSSPIDCASADLTVPATDLGRYGAIYLTVGAFTQENGL
jgi:prepilin-type N-terminal cleavage/methylation domain-containing protein